MQKVIFAKMTFITPKTKYSGFFYVFRYKLSVFDQTLGFLQEIFFAYLTFISTLKKEAGLIFITPSTQKFDLSADLTFITPSSLKVLGVITTPLCRRKSDKKYKLIHS